MQFREGYTFFDRWYSHRNNPAKPPEDFPVEKAREFTRRIEAELKKRGMLYHAVGHGWTCEAFGVPGLGWDPVVQEWPEEVLDSLALLNGKRAMWENIPLATSLCPTAGDGPVARLYRDYAAARQDRLPARLAGRWRQQ
jgi:hypothetical protein